MSKKRNAKNKPRPRSHNHRQHRKSEKARRDHARNDGAQKRRRIGLSGDELGTADGHSAYIASTTETLMAMIKSAERGGSATDALDDAFATSLDSLVADLAHLDPFQVIEAGRRSALPMMVDGHYEPVAGGQAAVVELLALAVLAAAAERTAALQAASESNVRGSRPDGVLDDLDEIVNDAVGRVEELLLLSQARSVLGADPADRMSRINMMVRGTQVLVRNSSYAGFAEPTVLAILDGNPQVHQHLRHAVGFDAHDAVAVLKTVHELQQDRLDFTAGPFAAQLQQRIASGELTRKPAAHPNRYETDPTDTNEVTGQGGVPAEWRRALDALFASNRGGGGQMATSGVGFVDIVAASGVPASRVRTVLDAFKLELPASAPIEVATAFVGGDNPLRSTPLLQAPDGTFIVPHDTLSIGAVKVNLEERLKESSVWETYQQHRGEHLETRVGAALLKVLPGSQIRNSYHYFVPNDDTENSAANPSRYTKRVEGDHLVLLDDVAFIVEDKAVALSALARGGKAKRVATDLTQIIQRAAAQATRLRDLLVRDRGLLIDGEGWVDLAHIREVHTIAVSMEDLLHVATASVELVRAGLLALDNIPWTVSLHDLELIVELTTRPAEFLLYVRRRRDLLTNSLLAAPDELDLFILMLEGGLRVEADPDQMRTASRLPRSPTNTERRAYREQQPTTVTSRTDTLDRWYYTRNQPTGRAAPKPQPRPCPIDSLVEELTQLAPFGWLSMGATLLGESTLRQQQLAAQPQQLFSTRTRDRQAATPLTQTSDPSQGWVFMWALVSAAPDIPQTQDHTLALREKLREWGSARGALLLYDETSQKLVHVAYETHEP